MNNTTYPFATALCSVQGTVFVIQSLQDKAQTDSGQRRCAEFLESCS